jgi:N-acetylneuraminic acid mutarotase
LNTWTKCASPSIIRYQPKVIHINDRYIYVFSGYQFYGKGKVWRRLQSAERFDIINDCWSSIAAIPIQLAENADTSTNVQINRLIQIAADHDSSTIGIMMIR